MREMKELLERLNGIQILIANHGNLEDGQKVKLVDLVLPMYESLLETQLDILEIKKLVKK